MLLLVEVILLIAVIRLFVVIERALPCAATYAGAAFLLELVARGPGPVVLVAGAVRFVVAWAYFALLTRVDGPAWWALALAGPGLVATCAFLS